MKLKFICLLTLFYLLAQNTSAQLKAQTAVVNGHLVDSKSKAPVPYAVIRIKNTGNYVMSDKNGDFVMQIPKMYWRNKEIKIEINAKGYQLNTIEFDTKKHKETNVFFIRLKKEKMLDTSKKK